MKNMVAFTAVSFWINLHTDSDLVILLFRRKVPNTNGWVFLNEAYVDTLQA